MRRLYIIFLTSVVSLAAMAKGEQVVTGKYTFYGEGSLSRTECERRALEGARIKALADAFGTTISQHDFSQDKIDASGERNFYSTLSETEVKGEWLEDIGEPQYERALDSDFNLMVTCTIKGRARAMSNSAPDFDTKVLRNGKTVRYADTQFKSGDDMYIYFKAPVDGYLVVYMVGDDNTVSTLLPYRESAYGAVRIRAGHEYVFFDPAAPNGRDETVDEIQLCTEADVETDRIYVLFSPNVFYKANDTFNGELLPRTVPLADFRKWLSKTRKADDAMGLRTIDIAISKP